MSARIFFRRRPDYGKCPSCNTFDSLRRSHSRSAVEHIINHTTFFRTFRCKNCGWRGYLSTLSLTWKSVKNLILYIMLGVTSAALIRLLLKKYF